MIKTSKTLFIAAFALVAAPALAGCATNGPAGEDENVMTLKMGTMMPLTGALASLGQDMENGAKLAIKQVNSLDWEEDQEGIRIQAFHEDDKTTDTSAITNTFNKLANEGVTAIAGPCCSGITAAVLDLAVQEEVVISTPSATSPALVERANEGFFWRVVPSDALQGKVLAQLVADNDVRTVNVIAVNNAYGNGLAKVFEETFTTGLNGVVTKTAKYNEGDTSFSSQVTEVCSPVKPEAVVLMAYVADAAVILKEMQNQGCLEGVQLFGSEGVKDPELVQSAGKGPDGNWLAAGMKGTVPTAANSSAFNAAFENEFGHQPGLYAVESYDAVMYPALAAAYAGSTDGRAIADALLTIANPPGTRFTPDNLQAAFEAALNGDDIDFDGYAHNFEFSEEHQPKTGLYEAWLVNENGEIVITESDLSA